MHDWLYFIHSNKDFHKLIGYLLEESGVSGITYLVFSQDVRCNDGRIFSRSDRFLVAVNFFTHSSIFKDSLVEVGLDPSSLTDLYDIVCEDEDPLTRGITITEGAKRIIFDKELKEFLDTIHFRFGDGSTLTIPKASLKYRL